MHNGWARDCIQVEWHWRRDEIKIVRLLQKGPETGVGQWIDRSSVL